VRVDRKHTPGPWKVIAVGNVWGVAPKKASRDADDICGGSQFHDNWRENSRLVASAPDLLDALRLAESWMVDAIAGCEADATTTSLPRGYPEDLKVIRAAIRKAGG
jgi:hypothetical protein